MVLLTLFCAAANIQAQTATITCTGTTGSFNSGFVTSGGTKTDGNLIVDGATTLRRGWASFDLSSIPAGSTVTSVSLKFTVTSNNAVSGVANGIFGFIGTPSAIAGATLYANCASGTNFNNATWAQNTTNTLAFNAAGITFITGRLGSNCNIGFLRGNGTAIFNIAGYPGALPPQLVINYTLPAYRAQFISMSTGATSWCAGETRTISVTVKNAGSATWTNSAPDVNLGLKWNTNGANWTDYYIRTDANNLAPGATQTYTFNITASNNIGAGYTTPLAAGTNNLSFDIVKEGDCWFAGNAGSCGPGNSVYTSPNQTIVASPAVPTGSATQTFCASSNPTVSNLTATGTSIKWYLTPTGGTALAAAVALTNGTHYYASQTNVSGCESATRLDVTVVINANSTIALSSAAGTDNQSSCAGVAITNIAYTIGGGGTGATVSGLAAGLTGNYSAGTYTISGAPTTAGTYTYTVTTTGPCTNSSATGTITVTNNGSITLTSGAGTNTQSVCLSNAITDITYSIGGTSTSASLTAGALPPGVTGSFSAGIFTITGTPTATGTYSYTIGTAGSSCINPTATGTITVNENATISLSSAAGTDAQVLCALAPMTSITYAVGGFGTTGATVSGLPAGVTGSYSAGVFTLSGSPTANGTFNYTVTTTGPCASASLSGSIISNNNGTVTLTSAAGTNAQSVCLNNAITNITYAIDPSATSASITSGALPAGVTGSFSSGVFTISGTPSVTGVFNYTVEAAGSACANLSSSGTITVNEDATISLSSAAGTDAQTICINTPLSNITYSVAGFGTTGATVSGLPSGVTGSYSGGVFTISGTPLGSGTFNYTITTTGPCANTTATGTITVQANSTIALTSGTASQTKCINVALTTVTYTMGGGATNISLTAGSFPAGVTGTFSAGVFTISGAATAAGVFPYTISATGPCLTATASGTITINDNSTITLTSAAGTNNQSPCISTAIVPITYLIGGSGTGATLVGPLPAGVTGSYNAGTKVFTISGTPTATGTFNYSVTTTGPCVNPNATGTIIVQANSTITLTSGTASQTKCINTALTTVNYTMGGGATNISLTAGSFPAAVTGTFSAGVFTISGTATAAGVFPYTLTATGPCLNATASGTITINDNSTITLTSAPGTTSQTPCVNTAITPITYLVAGGGTGVSLTGPLPAGVTGTYNAGTKVYTISGTPSATGTFNYTVTTTGPCLNPNLTGSIAVQANSTITLSSGTASQTKCTNIALTTVNFTMGGTATNIALTSGSFPAGVTGSFAGSVFTITGTPTVAGSFPYTLTASGPCANATASGTITVNDNSTITLTSAPSTTSQTKCINTAITNITYLVGGGGTGVTLSGALPAGVTGNYNSGTKIYTISGTPTVAGTFNYTVTTNGPCINPALSGTIIVRPNATIVLSSAAATTSQTLCQNAAITNITYTIGGSGTGATVTGLPPGVTGSFSGSTFTISGSPTAPGAFTYSVTTTGPCANPSSGGTITVNAIPTGTLTATENSGTPNNNVICAGSGVTFTATTGYGSYIFKVNGTIVQSGISNVYNSTTLTNGQSVTVDVANGLNCGATFGPIVITVNALPTATLSADRTTICPGENVTFTAGGGSSYTFKVNGSAVQSGASNIYNTTTLSNGNSVTVTVTNASGCSATSSAIVITVNSLPTGTLVASATSICAGDNVNFTATAGYSNYNFKVNGSTVQNGASNTFSSTTLTNPSVVTVDVTNAATCQATFNPIVITVNALPTGSLTATENSGTVNDNSICSGSTVSFTATAGFNNYNFKVNGISQQNGASNSFNSLSLLNGDIITVAATNGTNCTTTFNSITITVIPSPTGTLSASTTSICVGDNIDFTATAGYDNYDFQVNGSTAQNGSGNTYSSTSLVNGDVVTVVVTSANGCTSTFNPITITASALPTGPIAVTENSGVINNDGIICTGTTVLFTAPAGYSNYNFLLNAVSVQNGASNTYTNSTLANGDIINVAITNASNCIGLLTPVTITVNSYPVVDVITGTTSVCAGNTTTLSNSTAAGVWSSSNATVASVDAAGVVTGVAAGTAVITYTVTNANGCSTAVTILVTVNALPTVAAITGNPNVCVGNTTQLSNATAGGTWSSSDATIASVDASGLVSGVLDGTATISYSVTNAFNCTTIKTITITVNAVPVLNPITGDLSICLGNTSQLDNDTDGGIWSSDNSAVATVNSATGLVNSVSAGTANISYVVTDGNGCSATETATVTVLALPVPTLTGPNPICPNSTGIYTTEAGQSNYTWTFTGGTLVSGGTSTDNTITITWDQPGPKTITVNYTNADGCFGAASATVTTSTGITPFLSGPSPICLNSDGVYTTDPGQNNYTWTVVGGTITAGGTTADNTATVNWTSVGNQSISINYADVNGCTVISPTLLPVVVRPLPNAVIGGNAAVCQNAASPLITFTGSNGTAPYTFTYHINSGTDQTITTVSGNSVTLPAPTGATGVFVYNLTSVTDNNTCSNSLTSSVTVTVNELATATISGDATVCQNGSTLITFTGTAGTAPFTFSYNIDGGGTQTITTISGNSVTLTAATGATGTFVYNLLSVNDANGCTQVQTGSATVIVNPSPTATVSGTTSVCQNGASPLITFTGANGTAPYTFTYHINAGGDLTVVSVGNTATVAAPTTAAGVFVYTLTNVQESGANTCSQAQVGSATVTVNDATVAGNVGSSNIVCSGTNSGTLNLTGNTGSVINWEFSINGGLSWTPVANTTTSLTYTNLTQTTIYHAIVQSGVCGSAISGNATITVTPVSVGGTVNSNASVCSGTNGGTLTLTGHTGAVVRWEFSINGGASWTPIVNTTTTQTYTNLTQTTLYRAVVANGTCASVNSAAATITVTVLPTATISGTATVCQNAASPVITFTGANGVAPYTFTYKINAGVNLTVASVGSTATVSAPTATVGVFTYTLVSVTSTAGCTQNQTGTAVITVSALPATFAITPASANICQGTVQPLSAAGGLPTNGTMTFSSGNVNLAIPEGNRTSTIAVAGIPAGAIINSMSVNFNITHGYDGDLVLNLRAPNNNTLNLVNQRGNNGDNFVNTTISSTSVNPINAGTAPFTNTYSADAQNNVGTPNSNVALFSGLYGTPNGNWVFNAEDVVDCHGGFFACLLGGGTYYTGTLNSWSITFNYTLPVSPIAAIWTPVTGLYTDAGATTPYASQSLSTVYAKPNSTTTYTATTTNAASCTTTKTVTVTVSPTPVVTITADYCAVPGKVRLTATSVPAATSYIWSTGATTSFIDVDVAGSFDVTVFAGGSCPGGASINVAQELVDNGDFELGNVGFVTPPLGPNQYIYQADVAGNNELNPEGLYGVGPDAHTYHNGFWGHDHTTGTGNFMIINGFPNGNPQPIVWQETVTVLPNTAYYFAAWGMSVNAAGPFAQLQFNVNGAQVGTVATLPAGVNNNSNNGWTRFYGTWTSGPSTTTAVISITDLQNAAGGNDFGLDDISFATLSTFITLESGVGTNAQTLCVNTPLTNIVYSVGNGSPTGPTVTGLPAGVTSSYAGNLLTISGTPTAPGNFTYTITTTGGCLPTSATGTINVQAQAIALSSGSANTTACINTPVNIGYTLSGTATGATVTGLPAGVSGSVSGTTYTISGTPTVAGTFSYTITTSGTCSPVTTTGTINVQAQTVTLNSANNNQTVCINTPIANIQYNIGGTATGAGVTGLPAGVSFTYSGGIVFIFGSPTAAGSFTYTVTTTGNCAAATATGTLTVTGAATLALTSAAGTNAQVVCRNTAITNITYTVSGGTGASASGLPAGVTGTFSAGVFTISGTPTVNGVFNYTVSTTGGCGTGTANGTITVQSQTIVLTSGINSPTLCTNTAMSNIVFTIGGSATGATVSGLPAGVSYTVVGNTVTISGTPTGAGPFAYTVSTTGTCVAATATGTITVQPVATGGTVASVTICSGGSGTLTVTGQSGAIVRWEYTVDGGTTWTPIANTTITQTYNNIVDPTGYRAVINNGCGAATSTTAMIAIRNYWTGVTSTDWNVATNWADNQVPSTFCADVHIKGGKPNQPTLGSGTATVENIHIYTGAILTVTNATLQVSGFIDNTGTFIAATGTLEMNSTSAQTIPANTFQNNALGNLIVSNSSAAGLTLGGILDVYRSVTYTGTGRKLFTGGFLTFKSTATETAWLGNMTGNVLTGDATVERYIATGVGAAPNHGKTWQLLATPTTGQSIKQAWQEGANTVNGNPNPGFGTMLTSNVPNAATQPDPGFDAFTSPGPSIKTYNSATNAYVGPTSANNPLYNQKGYFILVRGDRSVTAFNQAANNTILRSKGILFTPSNPPAASTVTAGKFESVGNPYASSLDVRNISRTGGVDEFFYVWDPRLGGSNNLGAYQTLFKVGANYYAMPGGGSYGAGVNNFIQSGQAFLVQATGTNGTVGFSENAKASGSTLFTRQNEDQSSPSMKMLKTNLYTVNADGSTTLNDGTLNLFADEYSNELDGLDANKPANTGENVSVKSNGRLLAIERRHSVVQTDTIHLSLSGVRAQSYSFEFTANEMAADHLTGFVEDKYLGVQTPLNMEGTTFVNFTIENIPGSYAADRFQIVFNRAVILPVTFTNVKAYQHAKNINVEWKSENELNLNHYEVEKSTTGSQFKTIATKAPTSNNGTAASYLSIDEHPQAGYNYYRIRSVDLDGTVQYSNIVKVFMEVPKSDIAIYPNPITNGIVNLQLINQPAGNYDIKLFNTKGQVIYSKKLDHAEGSSTEKINWNYSLAHGTYLLEVIQPDGNKKVIKVLY